MYLGVSPNKILTTAAAGLLRPQKYPLTNFKTKIPRAFKKVALSQEVGAQKVGGLVCTT